MPQGLPPGYTPEGSAGSLAGGVVPWEQKEGGIFGRWWATVKAVNGDTRPFFATAAQNDKADAVTFSMMTGAMAGIFVGLLYILIFSVLGAAFLMGLPAMGGGHKSGAPAAGALAAVSVGIGIVYAIMIAGMSAVMGAVRPFISGGIHHVLLAMFGGLNNPGKGFMHSVRVAAYAEGATMPWFWIPIAGPFIGLFYIFKNLVQGYDETHRSGTGKAVLALVAPLVCCCACYLLVFLLVGIPAAMKP